MKRSLILLIGLVFSTNIFADQNLGLPTLTIPNDNPQSIDKISLGKLLFNENRFSKDGSVSCASCHVLAKTYTDGLAVAKGINGQQGTRNSPTLVNAAFFNTLFLDGRAKSLEEQALGPLINPIEHGLESHQLIVDVIANDTSYIQQFEKVFDIKKDEITIQYVSKAIASFERTLISGDSPFDRHLFGRDHSALSSSAERGLDVFKRNGNCVTCHEISWNNALFSDNRFYNIGVGFKNLTQILDEFIADIELGKKPEEFPLTAQQRSELGRFNVTKDVKDIGKFKTPTLRNIALTAPYMHDGSFKTLEEVIEHYDKGGDKNHFIDSKIFPLHLTQQEKKDLLEFMKSLTSSNMQ
jgi:cytochrome c peroxidase